MILHVDQKGTRTTVWNGTWGMGLARVSNSYPHTQFRTFPIALAVITTKMVIPKKLTSDRARWTELYIKYFLRAVQFIISRSEEARVARCWYYKPKAKILFQGKLFMIKEIASTLKISRYKKWTKLHLLIKGVSVTHADERL